MDSIWTQTAVFPSFPALEGDLRADAAIVGGGLDATTMFTDVLQSVIIVPMLVLAILLLIDGCKYIFANHEVEAA